VVLPPALFEELKMLPENKISMKEDVSLQFLSRYTLIQSTEVALAAINQHLTRNIPKAIEFLNEEIPTMIASCLKSDGKDSKTEDGWTTVHLQRQLFQLIAVISGRVFVGAPLCYDERWIDLSVNFTLDGALGAAKLGRFAWWKRPVIQNSIPEISRQKKRLSRAREMLQPIIEDSKAKIRSSRSNTQKEIEADDLITFLLLNVHKEEDVAQHLVSILFAAIHALTNAMIHALLDLASRPELIEELRNEVYDVRARLSKDGDSMKFRSGLRWDKKSLAELQKLDSFLKESQRFHPILIASGARRCQDDLRLSTGLLLPKGCHVKMNSLYSNLSSSSWTDPDQFDGLRFWKLRKSDPSRYQVSRCYAITFEFNVISNGN
jgi:ent-kaurene oxidase